MKTCLFTTLLFLSPYIFAFSQDYDKALAEKLNADEYGMKKYVFVILKSGKKSPESKEEEQEIFNGHQAHIQQLAEEGKLIVAGPLVKNDKSYEGIFIFDVPDLEQATGMFESDPAINAGFLDYESYIWYGSAALPVYLETHYRIEKKHH